MIVLAYTHYGDISLRPIPCGTSQAAIEKLVADLLSRPGIAKVEEWTLGEADHSYQYHGYYKPMPHPVQFVENAR